MFSAPVLEILVKPDLGTSSKTSARSGINRRRALVAPSRTRRRSLDDSNDLLVREGAIVLSTRVEQWKGGGLTNVSQF